MHHNIWGKPDWNCIYKERSAGLSFSCGRWRLSDGSLHVSGGGLTVQTGAGHVGLRQMIRGESQWHVEDLWILLSMGLMCEKDKASELCHTLQLVSGRERTDPQSKEAYQVKDSHHQHHLAELYTHWNVLSEIRVKNYSVHSCFH